MSRFPIIRILLISLLVGSCDQKIIQQEYDNNPVHVFESLWWEFDQLYALFEVKQVNWDSLYAVYRPQVHRIMTNEDLFNVLRSLLAYLNDNHILVYAEGMEVFRAGSLDQLPAYLNAQYEYFEADVNRYFYVLKNRYLAEGYKIKYGELQSLYGEIDPSFTGSSRIGYIHPGNSRTSDMEFIHSAFDALSDMDGLIIDLRFGAGNNERLATDVAGRCNTDKYLFITSRNRNGSAHNEFDTPTQWYTRPATPYFTNPVVLITNRHTIDAAEELVLAMRMRPLVTVIGDTTAGAFSSVLTRDLPNGWRYTLPKSLVYDSDGVCHEGVGLPPDIVARNDRNEMTSKIDSPLLEAINHLK